jgi:hypothetical protein
VLNLHLATSVWPGPMNSLWLFMFSLLSLERRL